MLIPTFSNQSRNFPSNSYWFSLGLSQRPSTSNQIHQTWRFQCTIQDQAWKALQSLNRGSLLYSFIVKSHAKNCICFHINKYKLIIFILFRDRVIYFLQNFVYRSFFLFFFLSSFKCATRMASMGKLCQVNKRKSSHIQGQRKNPKMIFFKGPTWVGLLPDNLQIPKKIRLKTHYYTEWAFKSIISCYMSWAQKLKLSHPINWAWCPWTLFLLKACTTRDGLTSPSTLASQIGSKSPNLLTTWIKFGSP